MALGYRVSWWLVTAVMAGTASSLLVPMKSVCTGRRAYLVGLPATTTRSEEVKSVEPLAPAAATAPTQSLEGVSSPEDSSSPGWSSKPSRTLRLRDAVWVREAMDDLVAAEFALRLDLADNMTEDRVSAAEAMQLSSVSGPDFERLREQLDRRCDELAASAGATVTSAAQREVLGARMRRTALALDDAARRDANKRARIRELLSEGRSEQRGPSNETLGQRLVRWASDVWFDLVRRGDAVAELGRLAVRSTTGENRTAVLYVRGDGSVDWEGALQGARAATAFSRDLWRRINGVGDRHDGDDEDGVPRSSEETARLSSSGNGWRRTETIMRLRAASDAALAVARARRQLSELVSTPDLQRSRYRAGEAELRAAEARMSLADLDLALERACAVLERDVDRTETDLDRTMLAEFALLDAQVVSLCRDAQYSPGPAILEPELNILSRQVADFVGRVGVASRDDLESCDEAESLLEARQAVVDAELAAVASKDDNFFFAPIQQPRKARVVAADDDEESSLVFFPRLWMSSQAETSRRQRLLLILGGALGDKDIVNPAARLLTTLDKLKAQAARGLAFYADGSKLLAADVAFCVSLVGRAFNGETLSQRDVRVLRRTLKDIATTIPFIIILLIPLSPVGHVLVFGAIQRYAFSPRADRLACAQRSFFPEFFPSCFTERRQNLVRLYSSAERYEFVSSTYHSPETSPLAGLGTLTAPTLKNASSSRSPLLGSFRSFRPMRPPLALSQRPAPVRITRPNSLLR